LNEYPNLNINLYVYNPVPAVQPFAVIALAVNFVAADREDVPTEGISAGAKSDLGNISILAVEYRYGLESQYCKSRVSRVSVRPKNKRNFPFISNQISVEK
jgi:hypothetical protein